MLVALKLKNGIHYVFEHFRSGERAFLVDMSDDEERYILFFGELENAVGTFLDLTE